MKILVIGLEGVDPKTLLSDDRLGNIRRLMNAGCFGPMEGVVPSPSFPAWVCMAASQDAGAPGIGDFRNRGDLQSKMEFIWDRVGRDGKTSILFGIPFGYGPRIDSGNSSVGVLDSESNQWTLTSPDSIRNEIKNINLENTSKDLMALSNSDIKEKRFLITENRFESVRYLIQNHSWDYFQFVEIVPSSIQQNLKQTSELLDHEKSHFGEVSQNYLHRLDEEIGSVLELLTDDTIVCVVAISIDHTDTQAAVVKGSFLIASTNNPLIGPMDGVNLLDIAPTLLELAGYEIPASMKGRSLVEGKHVDSESGYTLDEEEAIKARLSGLGYIS